jgi:ssDNA-specific exonuclease RecJ
VAGIAQSAFQRLFSKIHRSAKTSFHKMAGWNDLAWIYKASNSVLDLRFWAGSGFMTCIDRAAKREFEEYQKYKEMKEKLKVIYKDLHEQQRVDESQDSRPKQR